MVRSCCSRALVARHGPQNAVGLDALKAHAIACATAREHGGIVAPPDYWHIHELGGYAQWAHRSVGQVERAWMTAVPPWIHFKNICYQVRALDQLGFINLCKAEQFVRPALELLAITIRQTQ